MGEKVAHTDPEKSGEHVSEAVSLMEIVISMPAGRPRSSTQMHSDRFLVI